MCYGHKVITINGKDIWSDPKFNEIQPLKIK